MLSHPIPILLLISLFIMYYVLYHPFLSLILHYNFICYTSVLLSALQFTLLQKKKKSTAKSQNFVHINLCCPILSPLLLISLFIMYYVPYHPFLALKQSPLQCSTAVLLSALLLMLLKFCIMPVFL